MRYGPAMAEDARENRFRRAVPCLPVRDCAEAIRFYCEVLGFEKDYDDAILGRDEVLFACVRRDECEITLNQHDQQAATLIVGCEVEDCDRLYLELRERGVKILLAPKDEPWGQRHMAIEDLNGHEIHFSSRARPD